MISHVGTILCGRRFSVNGSRVRNAFVVVLAENMQLRVQIERSNSEIAGAANMLKERETCAMFRQTRIYELEKLATSAGLQHDPNDILRSESDAGLEATRRSLMDEFENQLRGQAASYTASWRTR